MQNVPLGNAARATLAVCAGIPRSSRGHNDISHRSRLDTPKTSESCQTPHRQTRHADQKANSPAESEQAALNCVYLAVMSLDPTGTGQKRWMMRWKAALNAFDITFDGRLSAGRK